MRQRSLKNAMMYRQEKMLRVWYFGTFRTKGCLSVNVKLMLASSRRVWPFSELPVEGRLDSPPLFIDKPSRPSNKRSVVSSISRGRSWYILYAKIQVRYFLFKNQLLVKVDVSFWEAERIFRSSVNSFWIIDNNKNSFDRSAAGVVWCVVCVVCMGCAAAAVLCQFPLRLMSIPTSVPLP